LTQYDHYLEGNVLTSSPIELVRIVYRFVIDQLGEAIRCTNAGDIEGRGVAVTKATNGIVELLSSLDQRQGGDVSSRLADLYGYCASRILQGHIDQDKTPFEEVSALMSTILQGWEQVSVEPVAPAAYEALPGEYTPINASF
jgi:flagellar secretion chaperone FliS